MINVVELDERINKCLSILEENPRSRIFAALAEAYRRRGDVGRAFSVCKNGLRIHPDYGAAHVVMSKLYLYQNMTAQALEAVEHAIKLDGPSRSSDVLLAEIYVMSGAHKQARQILGRLTRDGGQDPVVAELRKRLKAAVRDKEPMPPSSAISNRSETASAPVGSAVAEQLPALAELKNACTDPAEAVTALMRIPGMSFGSIYQQDGLLLASRGELGAEATVAAEQLIQPVKEIEQLIGAHGWGSLTAVRVESARGPWGSLTVADLIAVIVGTSRLGYAAASRTAIQCLSQLAVFRAVQEESVMPEDRPERVPH